MPQIKRIILIQPRSDLSVEIMDKVAVMSNTLVTVAAAIPEGIEILIVDENKVPVPWDLLDDQTVVGITCLTPTSHRAYELADCIRSWGVPVILGGIHIAGLYYSGMLEEAQQHADAVVIGEVEGLWEKILMDLEEGALQSQYRHGPRNLPDLSQLNMPRYDLAGLDNYWMWPNVQWSRGCPHACSFCSATAVFGGKVRRRPIADVIGDIQWLKAHGAKAVFFSDDNIAEDEAALAALCHELKQVGIKWMSQCHAEVTHNEGLLRLMRESGCYGMLVGFESLRLDPATSKKNAQVDVRQAVAAFHRQHILLIGCFVFGLPGQTDADREEIVRFILDEIDMPQLSLITPFPGTKEWRAHKDEILPGATWDAFTITNMVYHHPDGPERLTAQYDRAINRIFSRRQMARRSVRAARQHGWYAARVAFLVNTVYCRLSHMCWRPTLDQKPA
ncbi:B12-binding domain-containing radical SAM protein [Patescibacteria group bacterium]|nr:B12-binding domain-containing radical SAM protein [Patescibacteria group bacterium]MBU1673189.1 B12-binding domain-containing radical SAM protein [Patescibacteria group bacterium]MBU1963031.1 B12-binding domain-containing radical SAM protein [Patescibacteria group bacterium]